MLLQSVLTGYPSLLDVNSFKTRVKCNFIGFYGAVKHEIKLIFDLLIFRLHSTSSHQGYGKCDGSL